MVDMDELSGDLWPWLMLGLAVLALVGVLVVRRRPPAETATDVQPEPEPEPQPEPEPAPTPEPEPAGPPPSAEPTADGSAPPGYPVKGNRTSMLFHTVESPFFARTRGDIWFDSEESARAEGFLRWDER